MSYTGTGAATSRSPKAGSGLIPKATVPLGTRKARKHPLEFIERSVEARSPFYLYYNHSLMHSTSQRSTSEEEVWQDIVILSASSLQAEDST